MEIIPLAVNLNSPEIPGGVAKGRDKDIDSEVNNSEGRSRLSPLKERNKRRTIPKLLRRNLKEKWLGSRRKYEMKKGYRWCECNVCSRLSDSRNVTFKARFPL